MSQYKEAALLFIQALAIACASAFFAGDVLAQQAEARKDLVLKGDAKCTRCHDENDDYPVLAIGKTKHGTMKDARTPSCVSCHGESDSHINKPANATERPKPDRTFTKSSLTPVQARNDACMSCHKKDSTRTHWEGSTHQARDVSCTSCHQIHTQQDRVRTKLTQPDVCYTCHKDQRTQAMRPSRHPIPEGKVVCSDCHNPHGSVGPKLVKRDSVNDTCYTCHMEKRGPFVHSHPPVQEDCSICHQPHGTTIASLLKSRAPFLCQECHSDTSHRSQAGALPSGRTTSSGLTGTVARGCMNCHTNIHGSNSKENSATSGRFRR